MEFARHQYWSGLSFPSPRNLPDPRIELGPPALQADSLPTELQGKPIYGIIKKLIKENRTVLAKGYEEGEMRKC